jgi:hypothetical protein
MKIVVHSKMHAILKSVLWVAHGCSVGKVKCSRPRQTAEDGIQIELIVEGIGWNVSITDSAQLEKKPMDPIILFSQELDIGPSLEAAEFSPRPNNRILEDSYPQKLALTSPTSDGRSVGIVRSRTKATELVIYTSL